MNVGQYSWPGAAEFSTSQSFLGTSFGQRNCTPCRAHVARNLFCLAPEMNTVIQLGNFLFPLWDKTVSVSGTIESLPSLQYPLASSYGSSKGPAGRLKPVDIPAVRQTLHYALVLKQLLLFGARCFCERNLSKLQYKKYVHKARVSYSYAFG
jgi:hypothetical protein